MAEKTVLVLETITLAGDGEVEQVRVDTLVSYRDGVARDHVCTNGSPTELSTVLTMPREGAAQYSVALAVTIDGLKSGRVFTVLPNPGPKSFHTGNWSARLSIRPASCAPEGYSRSELFCGQVRATETEGPMSHVEGDDEVLELRAPDISGMLGDLLPPHPDVPLDSDESDNPDEKEGSATTEASKTPRSTRAK